MTQAATADAFDTLFPIISGDIRIAARIWTAPALRLTPLAQHPRRGICFPGWLDNAGSFDTLAPLLVQRLGLTLVCIDPPGCGFSDHRPRSAVYNDFEEVPLIGEVADQCGWETFTLFGHSRGGAICAWYAGMHPSRVIAFVCLESNIGMTGQFRDKLPGAPPPPEVMDNAVKQLKRNIARQARVFESISEAVEANKNNPTFQKSEATARNIVMRHIRPHPGGWTFIHDTKTYGQLQYLHVSTEQAKAFLTAITAPVLHILRPREVFYNKLPKALRKDTEARQSLLARRTEVIINGGHHLHSDLPEETCAAIERWLGPILDEAAPRQNTGARL